MTSTTAQANAFSIMIFPSNFDQSSPSTPFSNSLRDKAGGGDGRSKYRAGVVSVPVAEGGTPI